LPPSFWNFSGVFRKSTTSLSSSFDSERHRLLAADLDLADHEEPPEEEEQEDAREVQRERVHAAMVALALEVHHLVALEILDELGVGERQGAEVLGLALRVAVVPADEVRPHADLRDRPLAQARLELGVRYLRLERDALDAVEQREQEQEAQAPDHELLQIFSVHYILNTPTHGSCRSS
jgi:hypothetical protein